MICGWESGRGFGGMEGILKYLTKTAEGRARATRLEREESGQWKPMEGIGR